eukprot:GFYU01000946.1.p1 GENE.GFYU01000946.1~~GFYU01000946.1.p1  ORF type:complete len:333 (-),score=61.07 GFYU01000946.1:140-1138(-)
MRDTLLTPADDPQLYQAAVMPLQLQKSGKWGSPSHGPYNANADSTVGSQVFESAANVSRKRRLQGKEVLRDTGCIIANRDKFGLELGRDHRFSHASHMGIVYGMYDTSNIFLAIASPHYPQSEAFEFLDMVQDEVYSQEPSERSGGGGGHYRQRSRSQVTAASKALRDIFSRYQHSTCEELHTTELDIVTRIMQNGTTGLDPSIPYVQRILSKSAKYKEETTAFWQRARQFREQIQLEKSEAEGASKCTALLRCTSPVPLVMFNVLMFILLVVGGACAVYVWEMEWSDVVQQIVGPALGVCVLSICVYGLCRWRRKHRYKRVYDEELMIEFD